MAMGKGLSDKAHRALEEGESYDPYVDPAESPAELARACG